MYEAAEWLIYVTARFSFIHSAFHCSQSSAGRAGISYAISEIGLIRSLSSFHLNYSPAMKLRKLTQLTEFHVTLHWTSISRSVPEWRRSKKLAFRCWRNSERFFNTRRCLFLGRGFFSFWLWTCLLSSLRSWRVSRLIWSWILIIKLWEMVFIRTRCKSDVSTFCSLKFLHDTFEVCRFNVS